MSNSKEWQSVRLPDKAALVRKEYFELTLESGRFALELFESADSKFYAIGTPLGTDRVVVYGSRVCDDALSALQQTVDKIQRDCMPFDADS